MGMLPDLDYFKAFLTVHLQRAREARTRNEYGVSAVEWVVITAALVAIAGIVFVILRNTIRDRANSINLNN